MSSDSSKEVHPFNFDIATSDRERMLSQKGCVIWIYGLSGSGKSTLASALEKKLFDQGRVTTILDGDCIRNGLCKDLSFSAEDRTENLRRIAEVAKLFAEAGVICVCSFITPFKKSREFAIEVVGEERFVEVFVDTPLELCEQRDCKGLYAKARAGEIAEFTGINSPFERPDSDAAMVMDTDEEGLDNCVSQLISLLQKKEIIPGSC